MIAAARVLAAIVAAASISVPAIASDEPEPAAEPTRVGVLPLVIAGDAAPEVGDARSRLEQHVLDALSDRRVFVVSLDATDSGDAAAPFCGNAVCWQVLANQHGVSHFVVVVVHHDDPDYMVAARLIHGGTGAELGSASDTCDLCGITELGEHVGDLAATLRRELESTLLQPPVLVVTSTPPGALVRVDGEPVGTTPLELTSIAGPHRVEIEHPGHVIERRSVDLVDGTQRDLAAHLRPIPEPRTAAAARRDRTAPALLGSGIAGVVAGAGAIAGGVAMLAMHDEPIASDCRGDNVDALGRCRFLHDTRGGGIAVTAVGAGLFTAGVVLTVLGAKRRNAHRVTALATPTSFAVTGRF